MACEERREEKFVVPGGSIFSNTVEIDEAHLNQSIHELYYGAYQNLIHQLKLHTNMEVGLHIQIGEFNGLPQYPNNILKCRIETMPIVEQEYRYLKPTAVEPYVPYNRKCTFKERLKILFRR